MSGNEDKRALLIAKALKDPKFKAELLSSPAAAIEKATGVKVPAGVTIKIVEDTASVVHLVLPAAGAKGALSEKELEGVAGGASMKSTDRCDSTAQTAFTCGY